MTDLVASAARFPVPRAVGWRDKSAALQVWGPRLFILPHALVGVGLIAAMLGSLLWMLLGTTTQAEVQRTSSSRSRKGTTCSVTWAGPRGGEPGSGQVSCSQLAALARPGATVPVRSLALFGVRYDGLWLPTRPIEDLVVFPWFFGLFWSGITGMFVYLLYVVPARQRDLLVRGTPAEGVVLSKSVRRGKGVSYLFDYRYQTAAGPQEGAANVPGKERWDGIKEGAKVLVFYDPERPKRSVAYGHSAHRIVGLEPR